MYQNYKDLSFNAIFLSFILAFELCHHFWSRFQLPIFWFQNPGEVLSTKNKWESCRASSTHVNEGGRGNSPQRYRWCYRGNCGKWVKEYLCLCDLVVDNMWFCVVFSIDLQPSVRKMVHPCIPYPVQCRNQPAPAVEVGLKQTWRALKVVEQKFVAS